MTGTPLDSYLDPGERLLWSGQPKQGLRLQASDAFVIPFSLMWGGFAIVWELIALGVFTTQNHSHTGDAKVMAWVMPLWGIPFVVVGLYMMIGRFFFDSIQRKSTWFGVTDRRLIVLKTYLSRKVNSFDHASLTNLNVVERGDRSGDILFGSPGPMTSFANSGWPGSNRYSPPGFYLLEDARTTFNLIRDVQRDARK